MEPSTSKQKYELQEHDQNHQSLSVSQLESLPLKKRLEILFTVNIIPSRRQLAIKYGLDEQLIHNVLSHRTYLLQNWKYNSDAKRLLSKLDLENAKALMELLLEWKRRVQMNGLQMTDAALLRKAKVIQKILNASIIELTEDWRTLFEENWQNKHFHDNENDSLELEDILNDLQWMFTQQTFARLSLSFEHAKTRTRCGKRVDRKNKNILNENSGKDNQSVNEEDVPHNLSDIETQTDYYNDDDFECEDYELVLDEDFIMDSLRKELADDEAATYQQYMFGDDMEFECVQEQTGIVDTCNINSDIDTEQFLHEINESENDEMDVKSDLRSPEHCSPPIECSVAVPAKLESANYMQQESMNEAPSITHNTTILTPAPKPFRRKPRDMHTKLPVRKDSIRLPGSAEIANLVKKKMFIDPQNEDDEEEKEDNNENNLDPHNDCATEFELTAAEDTQVESNVKSIISPDNDNSISFKAPEEKIESISEVNQTNNDLLPSMKQPIKVVDLYDSIKQEITTPQHSDGEELITEQIVFELNSLHNEEQDVEAEFLNIDEKKLSNQHVRRSKRRCVSQKNSNELENINKVADDLESSNTVSKDELNENKFVPGGPTTNRYNKKKHSLPTSIKEKFVGPRKEKNKEKLQVTSVKIISSPTISKSNISNFDEFSMPQQKTNYELSFTHPIPPNATFRKVVKRMKRRTDSADLTLRRDKVRKPNQTPTPAIVDQQQPELNAQEIEISSTDTSSDDNKMVVEPYEIKS